MISWIAENALTVIVIAVVLVMVGIAVFSLIRDKKSQKSCCTGNCAACRLGCDPAKKK